MYTKKQIKDFNCLLANIIQAKEKLCEYTHTNGLGCSECPLNKEDKCRELNLPEFDFKDYQWLDIENEY